MKSVKLAVVAISFGLASAALAHAQSTSPPNPLMAAMRTACKADVEKLCAGKQGPEIRQCMMDNSSKLSKECADARAKLMASMPPK